MALTAPQNFTATAGAFYGEIVLDLDDLAGAVSYNYYRRLTSVGGVYTFIGASTASGVRAINLAANTSYDFVVAGVDADDLQGALSAPATATTIGPGDAAPRAPVGVQITPGNARNTLSWFSGAADVYAWHVKRATIDGGPYTQVPNGEVGLPNIVDAGLVNGTTYYYVITADNNLESANSAQVSGTPVAPGGGGGGGGGGTSISNGVYMRRRRR